MLIDLQSDDNDLWRSFFQVARDWDMNYAEIWLTEAAAPDLDRLAEVMRSSREWRVKTGEHLEQDFTAFSDALRSGENLEQIIAFRGKTHMQCMLEWAPARVELCVWPPDLLKVSDRKFERMIERPRIPRMPPMFPTVLEFARAVQASCDFRRVQFAMEGDDTNDAAPR